MLDDDYDDVPVYRSIAGMESLEVATHAVSDHAMEEDDSCQGYAGYGHAGIWGQLGGSSSADCPEAHAYRGLSALLCSPHVVASAPTLPPPGFVFELPAELLDEVLSLLTPCPGAYTQRATDLAPSTQPPTPPTARPHHHHTPTSTAPKQPPTPTARPPPPPTHHPTPPPPPPPRPHAHVHTHAPLALSPRALLPPPDDALQICLLRCAAVARGVRPRARTTSSAGRACRWPTRSNPSSKPLTQTQPGGQHALTPAPNP
jgi:hypothetical protein